MVSRVSVLGTQKVLSTPVPLLQVSFLEKKVTELENDSLTNGDLKSKLKQENTQLVHRSEAVALGWGALSVILGDGGLSLLLRPPREASRGNLHVLTALRVFDASVPCYVTLPMQGTQDRETGGSLTLTPPGLQPQGMSKAGVE